MTWTYFTTYEETEYTSPCVVGSESWLKVIAKQGWTSKVDQWERKKGILRAAYYSQAEGYLSPLQ